MATPTALGRAWCYPLAFVLVSIQELPDTLKGFGTGCNIGAIFLGAVAGANDMLLTAPTRGSMQAMLDACSSFSAKVGLNFSTDPKPAKTRAKLCLWLDGGQI